MYKIISNQLNELITLCHLTSEQHAIVSPRRPPLLSNRHSTALTLHVVVLYA